MYSFLLQDTFGRGAAVESSGHESLAWISLHLFRGRFPEGIEAANHRIKP